MCQGGLFFYAAVLDSILEEYPYEFVAAMSSPACDSVDLCHDIFLYSHRKRLVPILAPHSLGPEHQFVLCQNITSIQT